jgi:hypothetical protein
MTTTESYPRLVQALHEVRRRWRFQKLLEGSLLAVSGTVAVLVIVVAADNWLRFESPGRMVLAAILWGSLVAGLVTFVVRRWLEDRRDDFFAMLVEQRHPELNNQLINALQLGRVEANGFSPRLIEAIVNDAAQVTADLEMPASVDHRPVRRAAAATLVVGIVLAGYAAVFGARFSNGLARVFLPGADIPAYAATQVVSQSIHRAGEGAGKVRTAPTGVPRFPDGTAVVVEATVRGAVPAAAELVRISGEQKHTLVMQPAGADGPGFRSMPFVVSEPFDYYIIAGDGRSARQRVQVDRRPEVGRLSVTYTLPAYTGIMEPRRIDSGNGEIASLSGTRVEMELKATKALQEAILLFEGNEPINFEHGGDSTTWTTSFILWTRGDEPAKPLSGPVVQAPTRFQIRLRDTDSYENADPLWHSINAIRDQLPNVAITAPGRDLSCRPDAAIELAVEAKDDFGIGEVRLLYQVNEKAEIQELACFAHPGEPQLQTSDRFRWELGSRGLKGGDVVQYWAEATDRNDLLKTRPPVASRRFSLFLATPEQAVAKLDLRIDDYVAALEELVRLQRLNRAETTAGVSFAALADRQTSIRLKTRQLARTMEKDALPVATMVKALDDLAAGLMAEAVKLFESGSDSTEPATIADLRAQTLPVQDKIIKELEDLLSRLQRNEQAKAALRKLEKKDSAAHKQITQVLAQTIKDLDKLLKDETELAGKFERMPKKSVEEAKDESFKGLKDLEEFQKRWEQWHKGKIEELTKLPTGIVDDFGLRPDINKIFEEIEKAATRAKAAKAEVALEDLGAGLVTKMKEDLETWLPDSPDATKWVLEEPLNQKPMKIPEMPLPKALEDLVGDLLQKEEEFDQEADDVTSAWGDNLDQAGWGVSDGPISTFSAKGKTGNDLPNNMELTGRSGEGRRGKSSGQMVGDTAKGLQGRKTPARVGNERYEPGQLKQEGQQDPGGATGGGKKAGAGRKGLQGGTPPDFVRDMGRLSEKQAGIREKAEQVAPKLDSAGISSQRLKEGIELMKQSEKDLRDLRYQDAARKRRAALNKMHATFGNVDQSTATQLNRARDLPPQLRRELLQGAEEGYPPGYETLLKNYFKALSNAEK